MAIKLILTDIDGTILPYGKKALQKEVDSACVRRAMEVLSGVDSAGLLLFEGEIPYLVQGSRDDLLVCFPRYGETCIERDDVPSAGITKANVFIRGDLRQRSARQ